MVTLLQRYFPSSGQRKSILHWIFFGMAGVIWLMFIPNSAYIITEIRHLLDYCPVNSLRDVCVSGVWLIMFYFLYSVVGWVSFVLLLDQMKNFLRRAFNTELSRIFVLVVIPIISLGVLLGLINRFNSWEIFIQPLIILDVMLTYFTDLIYLANWIVFTLGLYILYLGGDILFKKRGAKTNNFSIQKEDANSGE